MGYSQDIEAVRQKKRAEIIRLLNDGVSDSQIRQMHGVSQSTLYNIKLENGLVGKPGRPRGTN